MLQQIFTALAGILTVAGMIPYIWAIINDPDVKPTKASWIIWFVIDAMIFAGMWSAGTLNGQMMGVMVGVSVILTLTLIKGDKGWTKLDVFSLIGAAVGIGLWIYSNNPVVAIVVAASINLIGAIPTLRSVWSNPRRESKLAWSIALVSCLFAVLAIPQWTLADAVQPIGFTFNNAVMVGIIYLRPLWLTV